MDAKNSGGAFRQRLARRFSFYWRNGRSSPKPDFWTPRLLDSSTSPHPLPIHYTSRLTASTRQPYICASLALSTGEC
jgi:hypothetical protein